MLIEQSVFIFLMMTFGSCKKDLSFITIGLIKQFSKVKQLFYNIFTFIVKFFIVYCIVFCCFC